MNPNNIDARRLRSLPALAALAALAACSSVPPASLQSLDVPPRARAAQDTGAAGAAYATVVETMPKPPAAEPPAARRGAGATPPPAATSKPGPFHVNFEQVPLTTLIQVVYADLLGLTVQIDPQVMKRRDLVTFRTPADQNGAQVESAMQLLLRSFGLAAIHVGGMVRVVPDGPQTGMVPEVRRGTTLPETPERMRPVFQLVDLEAVRSTDVANWVKTVIGSAVTVTEDATRNALMLSGTSDSVANAISVIRVFDQPVMRDRASLRVTPVYWSAQELAATLNQVLGAEGYAMPADGQGARAGGVRYPIILMPIPATNSLLVFAVSDKVMRHVQTWIEKLDQPNKQGAGKNFFTYTVRNVSAASLAKTLGELMQGSGTAGGAATPVAGGAVAPGAAPARPAAAVGSANLPGIGRVVVDSNSNTLIFNTSADNYSQLITLLNTLDQPSKAALIEVTVAEVTLGDDTKLGVEWLLSESGANSTTTIGTLGGLGIGNAGLTIRRLNSLGDTRLVLNALANTNRATILSSPRVMARNGETARIQIGQEVPIITSQQSGLTGGTGTNTGVLQTVQYRNTGVILSVKPSIFSGDRIDLDLEQEVSAAQTTQTGVNISPTISTRKVETKLTLQHGSTVMLGGLISSDRTEGETGVPLLKDIPLFGHLFKTDSRDDSRTELVVLITPYIINDDVDARGVTDAFKQLLPLLGSQLGVDAATPPRTGATPATPAEPKR